MVIFHMPFKNVISFGKTFDKTFCCLKGLTLNYLEKNLYSEKWISASSKQLKLDQIPQAAIN